MTGWQKPILTAASSRLRMRKGYIALIIYGLLSVCIAFTHQCGFGGKKVPHTVSACLFSYLQWFSGLHGAVEALAGRREQVPEFDEAGGRSSLRAAGRPRTAQAGGAL